MPHEPCLYNMNQSNSTNAVQSREADLLYLVEYVCMIEDERNEPPCTLVGFGY